jgi:signal transduction histidine kinase
MTLCFMSATAYSQFHAQEIGALSDSLAGNAMASIEHLATARTELRHLQSLTDDYIAATGVERPKILGAITDVQDKIDLEMDAYLRLPAYPEEHELFHRVRVGLVEVDSAMAELRAFVREGDRTRAAESARRVDAACDKAVLAAFGVIQFNAKKGETLARRIGEARRLSLRSSTLLDALCGALTVGLALLATREVNRHARALNETNRLLARRADELEQFAGRVAHDVRNPIGGALLSLDGIRLQSAGDAKTIQMAERGVSSLRRATRFLDGLLEFACAGARPQPDVRADVRAVIESTLADFGQVARESNVELRAELSESAVRCDSRMLELVASNLIRNAIRYMGDGPERTVTVRSRDVGSAVRIEVLDTGIGVPPHLRSSIFEPFVRASAIEGGVGLGLATVKRICERHGGRVGLESRRGGGSVFWFELPSIAGDSDAGAADETRRLATVA